MADNTTLNPGTGGDTIATDDIAGVKHQLVKLEYGAADSATQVSPTNPLPVVLPDGTTATRSAFTATTDTQALALNTTRKRATFYNDGDKDLLLSEGTAVTTSDFTVRLRPGAYYSVDDYTGSFHALFVTALGSGQLQITEIT